MNEKEVSVDVLNEPVSHETSLYFFRHFTSALEKIRKEEMEKYKKKLYGTERELAEVFSTEYMRKIINVTALQIGAMSEKSDVKGASMALAQLFNAESIKEKDH